MPDPGTGADDATALYRQANALKDAGQLAEALAAYDRALELQPDHAHALCNRGVVLAGLGRFDAALASYERALALEPRDAITHYNRGAALLALGRAAEALASYDEVVRLDRTFFHAHLLRGNLRRERGEFAAAIGCYGEAIEARPDFAEAWFNRGVLRQQTGQTAAAIADFERALVINPALFQAAYNRGNALRELHDPARALASYDAAIAIRSDYPEAWCNRGVTLQELRRWDEALHSYERAIALNAGYAEAWFNRGSLLNEIGRPDGAVASYDRAIGIRADHARAWCNRGAALIEMRRVDAALASYDRAIALVPDFAEAHYNRALTRLLRGDYVAGWPEHEWRWKNAARLSLGAPRGFRQPLWLGREDLAGRRILLWAEQGLGDTLQFCRYARLVRDRGAQVILEVQPPLVDVLAGLDGVAQLVRSGAVLPEFDAHCPLMSLALAFRTTLHDIPGGRGYVHADPAKVAFWQHRLGPRAAPRIGIVWSGNPGYANDAQRSTRLEEWLPHLPRHLRYFCLQRDVRDAERPVLAANPWIEVQDPALLGFGHTAALISVLDLVISVDTSPGHLSGALGQRTWTLLSFNSDWRWLLDRDDSPWYPATRLYRQATRGDWRSVLQRVGADLQREFG